MNSYVHVSIQCVENGKNYSATVSGKNIPNILHFIRLLTIEWLKIKGKYYMPIGIDKKTLTSCRMATSFPVRDATENIFIYEDCALRSELFDVPEDFFYFTQNSKELGCLNLDVTNGLR